MRKRSLPNGGLHEGAPQRIRVRRDRPSALTWALALAVTMLAVYLITLSAPIEEEAQDASADARVTQQITLEGMSMYFADLGAYPQQWRARVAAAAYTARGAAGAVYADGDGYHVLGAGYAFKADAERIAQRLSEQSISASVLELSAPQISLRITAAQRDVAAIAEADSVLRRQLQQICALALQIDRGEVSASSARTLMKVSAAEARSARKALEAVRGSEDQPICTSLIRQLGALDQRLSQAAECSGDAAELSGQLRNCHVQGCIELIAFLNAPAG